MSTDDNKVPALTIEQLKEILPKLSQEQLGEPLSEEVWLELCNAHKENRVTRIGKPVNLLSMPIVPRKTPSDT